VDPCSKAIGFRLAAAAGLGIGILGYYLLWELGARLLEGGAGSGGARRQTQPPDPAAGVAWVDVGAAVGRHERHSRITFVRTLALALSGLLVFVSLAPAKLMVGLFALSGLIGLAVVAITSAAGYPGEAARTASPTPPTLRPPQFLTQGKRASRWILLLVFLATMLAGIGLGAFWAAGGSLVCPGWGDPLSAAMVGALCLTAGQFLLRYTRERAVLRVHELLKVDRRPPVLYLRSFRDDAVTIRTARWARRTWLDRLAGPYRERFEHVVAWHLWRYGPVVTVSQPGRSPWRIGAVRDELPIETWQQDIQEWLLAARLIIVTIGRTAGLQWELERINDLGLWSRVVLLFPPVAEKELLARWRIFRGATLARVPGLTLPAEPFGALAAVVRPGERPTLYAGARRDEWGYRVALEAAWQGRAAAASPSRVSGEHVRQWAEAVPGHEPGLVSPPAGPGGRSRTFYAFLEGHVAGPYGFLQLRTMAANRQIVGTTQITTPAGPWFPASELPGLPSTKKWEVALGLSLSCGWLGLDRFYLGDVRAGYAKLLTGGGFIVWWLADIIRLANLRATDARGWRVQPRSPIVWAWMPLLSLGLLAWVPPLHAWLKSRNPVHLRLTIGLAAVSWIPLALAGIESATTPDSTQTGEPTSLDAIDTGVVLAFLLMVAVGVITAYSVRDIAFGLSRQTFAGRTSAPDHMAAGAPGSADYRPVDPATDEPLSDKSRLVAGLLGIFLGWLGAGRFYTGDTRTALRQLVVTFLTCGAGGLWGLIDGIAILVNGGYDAQGRKLRDW
jgi:TM2 domain-containing membrane protein YozV